jgi:hypothetical protein
MSQLSKMDPHIRNSKRSHPLQYVPTHTRKFTRSHPPQHVLTHPAYHKISPPPNMLPHTQQITRYHPPQHVPTHPEDHKISPSSTWSHTPRSSQDLTKGPRGNSECKQIFLAKLPDNVVLHENTYIQYVYFYTVAVKERGLNS